MTYIYLNDTLIVQNTFEASVRSIPQRVHLNIFNNDKLYPLKGISASSSSSSFFFFFCRNSQFSVVVKAGKYNQEYCFWLH